MLKRPYFVSVGERRGDACCPSPKDVINAALILSGGAVKDGERPPKGTRGERCQDDLFGNIILSVSVKGEATLVVLPPKPPAASRAARRPVKVTHGCFKKLSSGGGQVKGAARGWEAPRCHTNTGNEVVPPLPGTPPLLVPADLRIAR